MKKSWTANLDYVSFRKLPLPRAVTLRLSLSQEFSKYDRKINVDLTFKEAETLVGSLTRMIEHWNEE